MGKRLLTLNDRPALDVYLERHRIRDEAEFGLIALLHPFGVAAARGRENQVRAVVGADFEARTLSCNSEVPAGTLIWPMTGEPEQVARATTLACHEALAGLAGRPPRGLLALDSVARAGVSDARARIAVAVGRRAVRDPAHQRGDRPHAGVAGISQPRAGRSRNRLSAVLTILSMSGHAANAVLLASAPRRVYSAWRFS